MAVQHQRSAERRGNTAPKAAELHLVVLQHGLWGDPSDMAYVGHALRKGTDPRRVVILNSGVNRGRLTYDGIDVLGDRLCRLVTSFCTRLAAGGLRRVTRISFVAYSLGGLICRYAVGKLAAQGFFTTQDLVSANGPDNTQAPHSTCSKQDGAAAAASIASVSRGGAIPLHAACPPVKPVNFITFASPHLGSWQPPDSLYKRAFNTLLPFTLSRTGSQLVYGDSFLDDLPLLSILAHPSYAFHAGLSMFEKRVALANLVHDATVPYFTAAMDQVPTSEWEPISDLYPCIMRPCTGAPSALSPVSWGHGSSDPVPATSMDTVDPAEPLQIVDCTQRASATAFARPSRDGGRRLPACAAASRISERCERAQATVAPRGLSPTNPIPAPHRAVGSGPGQPQRQGTALLRELLSHVRSPAPVAPARTATPGVPVAASSSSSQTLTLLGPCSKLGTREQAASAPRWRAAARHASRSTSSSPVHVRPIRSASSGLSTAMGPSLLPAPGGGTLALVQRTGSGMMLGLPSASSLLLAAPLRHGPPTRAPSHTSPAVGRAPTGAPAPPRSTGSDLLCVLKAEGQREAATQAQQARRRQRQARLQGEVFWCLLPLFFLLWCIMLLMLVCWSWHHYLLLLVVRKDRSWDMRWRRSHVLSCTSFAPPAVHKDTPLLSNKATCEEPPGPIRLASAAQPAACYAESCTRVPDPTAGFQTGPELLAAVPECVVAHAGGVNNKPQCLMLSADATVGCVCPVATASPSAAAHGLQSGLQPSQAPPAATDEAAECATDVAMYTAAAEAAAVDAALEVPSALLPESPVAAPAAPGGTIDWNGADSSAPATGSVCSAPVLEPVHLPTEGHKAGGASSQRPPTAQSPVAYSVLGAGRKLLQLLLAPALLALGPLFGTVLQGVQSLLSPRVLWEQVLVGWAGMDGAEGEVLEGGGGDGQEAVCVEALMRCREGELQQAASDHLNLMSWHKVAVDTQHYHAHAAVVVRSTARFAATHGHVVDYALRQMRGL